MAMQPEVVFTIYPHYQKPIEKKAVLGEKGTVFSGISITEYQKVDVKLICPEDQEAILNIQTSESDEVIKINPDSNSTNIMSGGSSEYMLVPGHYRFEVLSKKKKFNAYYTIRANNFSDEALLNLRQYAESLLKGLSQDLIRQRSGMVKNDVDFNPGLMMLFRFIKESSQTVFGYLDLIAKNPITELFGEYKVMNVPSKLNSKNFKWQAQKGTRKNTSLNLPDKYYIKHAKLSSECNENTWMSYIIEYFIRCLRKLEMSFQNEINNIALKIMNQESMVKENEEIINKWSNKYGYKDTIRRLRIKEERINKTIGIMEIERLKYLEYKYEIQKLSRSFASYQQNECFNNKSFQKPIKVSQKLLKDFRYKQIYTTYKELIRMNSKQSNLKFSGVQFRKTWQLFEYYNLGLAISILIENQYNWVSGWLADKDNPHQHIGILPPNTIMRFEKENSDHFIEVAYDTEIATTIDDKNKSCYFTSTGRRPDIRITIFLKNGALFSDKCGLIIESKCRRHNYLINQNIDPDVKIQLSDFRRLEYFDSNSEEKSKNPVKTPIDKVIVLYPKQNGKKPVELDHIYRESMVYIQVEPSDQNSTEESFGFFNLKKHIDEFLLQTEEE
ncbi:hypothetical protein [Sporosarcina cascadiensis]|uniref:hypothetical protein n=1 Tax=Sporosarcina cascadiensis TaxID=2660747 RepID=UPI00129C00F6|nr:hypothetical protein [Sporosarcina cascadiensis]